MKFDDFTTEPCVPGNEGDVDVNPSTCTDAPPSGPSSDDRCADPAFRAANPDICKGYPLLILKPGFAITQEGSTVQYKTFLRTDGDEYEITTGLAYAVSDLGVAVITAGDGLATGVKEGTTTVSVTWQNLSATAQLDVVALCSNVANNFLILIDNSASSGAAFSSQYSSRLAYAKEAARRFAESVNFGKDKVGVAYFNEAGVVTLAPSDNKTAVLAAIAAISGTMAKTNLASGLQSGMAALDVSPAGRKILVLFSDGESNQGADPVPIADVWKQSTKTILVIGLRAWGQYFDQLYRIASVGYFLNAYNATQSDVIDTIRKIKSYLCSSDCDVEGGTFPTAHLNYDGFTNWDVFQGAVDLVGLGVWDVLPGNGLYVDLAGTRDDLHPDELPGGLVSKNTFNIVSGRQYRFRIDVAGNNVGIANTDPVRVRIYSVDGTVTFLDQTITPSSSTQPFTTTTYDFTAAATKTARIKIEMIETGSSVQNCGPLIDNVYLEDLTGSTVLLYDDFNNENLVYTPPGYSYYGGCIESPVGAQNADPTPPPVVE